MLRKLINHSPDLQRLHDEGYQMEWIGGYLVIRHIPYVNANKEVKYGSLVSPLTESGNSAAPPNSHVIFFIGEHPCYKDGSVIAGIKHASSKQNFHQVLTVDHSFSNKPPGGYSDHYAKIKRYADIIADQARSIDSTVTDRPYLPLKEDDPESIFQYFDYNSSRAGINLINAKLEGQKIAIIGLGGTGAYILDLVAKTAVKEIHIFDSDEFMTHNAFRSPGAASKSDLQKELKKVHYYERLYSQMHKGLIAHPLKVGPENLDLLNGMNYVFIAIDKGFVKKVLTEHLLTQKIPFIDVGMTVLKTENKLLGQLRVTTATEEKSDHISHRISMDNGDDNDYSSNIQIAELNAFNAILAVIKWKKLSGFYQDLNGEFHTVYDVNTATLYNEEEA